MKMDDMSATDIFTNLIKIHDSDLNSHEIVPWFTPKAVITVAEIEVGVYSLIIKVLSVNGKTAVTGVYDFSTIELAEFKAEQLKELYFNN